MVSKRSGFTHPPEWSDEERMYYLLAPFPPNVQSPLSDPKMAFWRSLILSSSFDLQEWVFTERELSDRFRWHGIERKSLFLVINALEKSREIQRLCDYQGEGIGWAEQGMKLLSRPVSWAWRRYVSGGQDHGEVEFVLVSLIKVVEFE